MARSTENGLQNEPSIADLNAQIETLKADLGQITAILGDMGKVKTAEFKSRAAEGADAVRQAGASAQKAVTDRAHDAQARTEAFVRDQPATALGIAAGLGFLVGLISARK